jgi:hypothetical protein
MRTLCPILAFIFSFVFLPATAQDVTLEFHARHTCEATPLDSIRIENLSQGGTMVLYYPDNTVVFTTTGIGDFDPQHSHLHVSQNYPNPFSSLTYVDVLLASPERLSLEVYDLKGRLVSAFEENLDAGLHHYSFSAGGDHTYILSARSGMESRRRIMLQMGTRGQTAPWLTYLGKGEADIAKTSPKSADFAFTPGDELRFTGFVTDFSGAVDYGVLEDAPHSSTEYLFDIADTPPDTPSEIDGADSVVAGETGLIYQVEETPGLAYHWMVPAGWAITQGQGTGQITVDAGDQGGDIRVKAENSCGESQASVLAVEVFVPVYQLSLDAEPPEGGEVTGSGEYHFGDEIPTTATASEGWHFTHWTGDTQHVDDPAAPTATVTMPANDITLTAHFELTDYQLSLTANPEEGGAVSGSGEYHFGEEIPITATANEGWHFTHWTGDTEHLDDPAAPTATVTMPANDITLTAHFELTDYQLSLTANPEEGGITTGAGTHYFGEEIPITATANEGWHFTHWTGDTEHLDDPAAPSATVSMPANDITLTAHFELTDYQLSLTANPIEGGTVSGSGEYHFGEEIPTTATANEGWEFTHWTGETGYIDDPLSPNATVIMPATDIALSAGFAALPVVQGTVTDLLEETPLVGAQVKVYCADGDVLYGQTLSDDQGYYQVLLPLSDSQQHYLLEVTREAYQDYSTWFTVDAGSQLITLDVALTPVMYQVSGYVVDIFEEFGLGDAFIEIDDNGIIRETISDEDGFFSITVYSSGYLFTTIEIEDYVKRHTWVTINESTVVDNEVEINFTIVPLTYPWSLYTFAFRNDPGLTDGVFPFEKRFTTRHWVSPPNMHFFNDTSNVGGQNIDVQFSNLVYNAQNILPTFNPRDALPENVVIHQEFGYTLQDNEIGANFDDSISGAGIVIRLYAGPRMNRCVTRYRSYIGLPYMGPDNVVFNQELGSCFGAVREPAQSDDYVSVFTDPSFVNTYTQDDYDSAKIMLDRLRVHYRNLTYDVNEPEGWDWEMRPDEVEFWYSDEAIEETHLEIIVFGYEGEVLNKTSYAYDEIPYKVMEENPMLFTKEEARQRRLEQESEK